MILLPYRGYEQQGTLIVASQWMGSGKERLSKLMVSFVENITWWIRNPFGYPYRTHINTLRTGDADLRFYITTVQDG